MRVYQIPPSEHYHFSSIGVTVLTGNCKNPVLWSQKNVLIWFLFSCYHTILRSLLRSYYYIPGRKAREGLIHSDFPWLLPEISKVYLFSCVRKSYLLCVCEIPQFLSYSIAVLRNYDYNIWGF